MKRALLGAMACLSVLCAAPAFAEDGAHEAAERAYQDVDFPSTHQLAEHALESGAATRSETARLYVLLGISAAALGDAAEAKQDFVAALAIEPTLKLEKSLSPKIREPYLEAQGYWSAASERLALSAKPAGDGSHLVVRLSDPEALVNKVELRIGPLGDLPRSALSLEPSPATRFPLPASLSDRDYQYALRALDRYGNVLAEYGVESDPIVARRASSNRPGQPISEPARGRSYFWPVALGVVGLGAAGAGAVFHVQREQAAQEWNGPRCEAPGQTRLGQCANIDTRIRNDERLAIGLYAAGGALLTGSLIALLAGHGAPKHSTRAGAVTCVLGGPGVACAGSF
jgi:hypothetical protein